LLRASLNKAIKSGDLDQLKQILGQRAIPDHYQNQYGRGWTPLMYAAANLDSGSAMIKLLIEHGADLAASLKLALGDGDPRIVAALVLAGADIHYVDDNVPYALIDAVHNRDLLSDTKLLGLLDLLIDIGVNLDAESSYRESGMRRLSQVGRFDGVAKLIAAGSDVRQIEFADLAHAIVFGTLDDVETALRSCDDIEVRDWWERTPFHLAVMTGDIEKAQMLLDRGAPRSTLGRFGASPLEFAVDVCSVPMIKWLIELRLDVDHVDEFGSTPLISAVEQSCPEVVKALIEAGADVNHPCKSGTALNHAENRDVALLLLQNGADPLQLTNEGRRAILGFAPVGEELDVTKEDFLKYRVPTFGKHNPDRLNNPFWDDMLRSGLNGYGAAEAFHLVDFSYVSEDPTWCAHRFGQSITSMPDGRTILIAGEHEDHYDPDFYIYNDVFVQGLDGSITVYGYPEEDFPTTDFHTATLVGIFIYIIGCLGYSEDRMPGFTPVFKLDTTTYRIERLTTTGDMPGWIFEHKAQLDLPDEIVVCGGKHVILDEAGQPKTTDNSFTYVLNIESLVWSQRSERTNA
jgi:ankyrin repeat protein